MANLQKGNLVLLKIGDGASPSENFTTIGGMRTTELRVSRNLVTDADVTSGMWRSVMESAGQSSVRIRGNGLFVNQTAHDSLMAKAMNGAVANYQFHFANGDQLSGAFLIADYARSGEARNTESFAVTLESAGSPTFTAAS